MSESEGQQPTNKSNALRNLAVLGAILVLSGGVMVKVMGGMVKAKYSQAESHVQDKVLYEAPSERAERLANARSSSSIFGSKKSEPQKVIIKERTLVKEAPAADYAGAAPEPMPEPMPAAKPAAPSGGIVEEREAPSERNAVVHPDTAKKAVEVNPMTETAKDKFSTFAVDVDTGSYTIARRSLQGGFKPTPSSVRVEEFVNYFAYDYPNPESGAFGVSLEAAPSPFITKAKRHILRVGVQGKRLTAAERKPVHLTFLVDVSGSMGAPDKLPMAKRAMSLLVSRMRPEDTIAITTYAGRAEVVLEATNDKAKINAALNALDTGGGTSMGTGMELAYQQALKAFKKGDVNRVIVLSDGDANIGASSFSEIFAKIKGYVSDGVTLSAIGFGMGNYRDDMMEQLANKGNGNYYYIDTDEEAQRVFGEQADGTLQVIAKDVKIQVEFNPKAVTRYRLIGYENRAIADRDFRNDAVDAGEIGAGHTVTALYEIELTPEHASEKELALVRMRHKEPDGFKAQEQIFRLSPREVRAKLSDASKDLQFATAVATFAEILRGSEYAKGLSFALVKEIATSASSSNQKDRQEFIKLVEQAAKSS